MRLLGEFGGLRAPQGIAVSGQTAVVADTGNHRLGFFDLASNPPARLAVVGFEGTDPNQEGLLFPAALCFVDPRTLVVADTWNRHIDIYAFLGGTWVFQSSLSAFSGISPIGHLVDIVAASANSVLVLDSDQKRILRVDITSGNTVEAFSNSQWRSPAALASGGGYLWVADAELHRIFRYDIQFNEFVFGGFGNAPGQLNGPRGIIANPTANTLYVSESRNARISAFDFNGNLQGHCLLPPGIAHELHKLALDNSGRVFACDAAGNRVYVLQPGASSTAPFLERSTINYGSVGVGYRVPQPVIVHNPSASSVQILAADLAGPQFALDGTVGAFPKTIPANGSLVLLLIFAPTGPGIAFGQLRLNLTSTEVTTLNVSLKGEGFNSEPTTIALILDHSGSMRESSGSMSKIERLQQAAGVFVDIASWNGSNELTIVSFSNSATSNFPRTSLTNATINLARAALDALAPGGMTSIGAGLQLGLTQLTGSEIAHKEIIVLSDGKENTVPMISDVMPNLGNARVFTVGLGLPALVDVQKLQTLATVNGGYFQVTDGNDELLPKFFIQILVDVMGQQLILDPRIEIEREHAVDIKFYVSDSDFNTALVLTWDHDDSQLECQLISPEGRVLNRNEFWNFTSAKRYQAFRVPLRGSRWEKPGEWRVRIRLNRASVKRELAFMNIMTSSEINLEWQLIPRRRQPAKPAHRPSNAVEQSMPSIFPSRMYPSVCPFVNVVVDDALRLAVRISEPFLGARFIGGTAWIRTPAESFSKVARESADVDLDRVKKPQKAKASAPPRWREYEIKVSKSGQNAFLDIPVKGHDGFYCIRVLMVGITRSGHKFQRERSMEVFARPKTSLRE